MAQPRPRALLIDDERFARQLYSDYLQAAGCDVDCAESAHVARALFVPGRYSLVVTDLLLPDSDGLEVLAFVKEADPEVDVIVITGLERVEPAVRALRGGASDYLIKPVTPDTLQLAVSRCLSMRRVLQENAQLKSSVTLLEASQRIALAGDRGRVADGTLPSLLAGVGAKAGALVARTPQGALELLRADGIAEAEREPLLAALSAGALDGLEGDAPSVVGQLPGTEQIASLASLPWTVLVPVASDGVQRAAAVLFSELVPGPGELQSAGFLAKSAAVSLASIQRFDHAERLAFIDDLTHLFNARYLQSVLERETGEMSSGPFSLLFLDLDHFKQVNDTHGHLIGSKLLIEVARVLKSCVREGDVCTRYGGDEFCVVLPKSDEELALRIAERIRSQVAGHRFLAREGCPLQITASIGIACFPTHAQDKTQLLELADRAMYRGKRTSRNVIYLASGAAA